MSDPLPLDAITNLDKLIHEPARLAICMLLYVVESADFLYLMQQTKLTKGNLSSHLSKLESAGYVEIEKTFAGKVPRTLCRLTPTGRTAFADYLSALNGALGTLS